jgi:hypothetical protein
MLWILVTIWLLTLTLFIQFMPRYGNRLRLAVVLMLAIQFGALIMGMLIAPGTAQFIITLACLALGVVIFGIFVKLGAIR